MPATPDSDFCRCSEEQYDFIVPESRANRPGVVAFKKLLQQAVHARGARASGDEVVHELPGGIVLCGGRSTRMGSSESARCPSVPRRCCSAWCGCSAPSSLRSWSSPRREQSLPELPADVIVTRDEREDRGPLEGLRAGLKALPELRRDRVRDQLRCAVARARLRATRMIELLGDHDIAVMEIDGFPHPLSAVYRRDTLPHVEALLAQDRLAAGVPVRCRAHSPRAAGGNDLRRSAASHAAQSQYAGRLSGALLAGAGITSRADDDIRRPDASSRSRLSDAAGIVRQRRAEKPLRQRVFRRASSRPAD